MRNIDFKDTESLEYLISLLVEDSNVLKEKLVMWNYKVKGVNDYENIWTRN